MMTSRWSYEALAVDQFKHNKFQKVFFEIDQKISSAEYLQAYLVTELLTNLDDLEQKILDGTDPETVQADLQILNEQLAEMGKLIPELAPYEPGQGDAAIYSDSTSLAIKSYLNRVSERTRSIVGNSQKEKNDINNALIESLGGVKAYTAFRNKYDNKSLNELVLSRNVLDKVFEKDGRMIRKHQPAYMKPTSRIGRGHLYAPNKQIGNLEIDTLWYNMAVIWIYNLLLYAALRYDLLRKVINFSENRRLTRKQTT
jgi:hypothetical protein